MMTIAPKVLLMPIDRVLAAMADRKYGQQLLADLKQYVEKAIAADENAAKTLKVLDAREKQLSELEAGIQVKLDKEFSGREARLKDAQEQHQHQMTIEWNAVKEAQAKLEADKATLENRMRDSDAGRRRAAEMLSKREQTLNKRDEEQNIREAALAMRLLEIAAREKSYEELRRRVQEFGQNG